jgi:hypothetical protein
MSQRTRSRLRRSTLTGLLAVALIFAGGTQLRSAVKAPSTPESPTGQTVGPDVTVSAMTDIGNYGGSGGMHGYTIGTESCNVGTVPVWWCDNTTGYCNNTQHPVIGGGMYKLLDGRFSQIGVSWLKHGFLSLNTNQNRCLPGIGCSGPPHGGDQLGVGCTDIYTAGLNASRPLGMRQEVDVTTGVFPYPYHTQSYSGIDEYIKVDDNDLDPALNAGASYFAQAEYVTADDAQAGNGLNNATYQTISVGPSPNYTIGLTGTAVRESSAIHAWQAADGTVEMTNADFAGAGSPTERFEIARKVTDIGGGMFHYEYAINNLNSDRSAQKLLIRFTPGTTVSNIGFHAVDHHSGECQPDGVNCYPISNTDWTSGFDAPSATVSWETEDYATNNEANAMRWGTLFNFWFDADADSSAIANQSIILFKPGTPCLAQFTFDPSFVFSDGFETGDTCSWSSITP